MTCINTFNLILIEYLTRHSLFLNVDQYSYVILFIYWIFQLFFNEYFIFVSTYDMIYNKHVYSKCIIEYYIFCCRCLLDLSRVPRNFENTKRKQRPFLLHLFIPPPAHVWFSGGSTKMRFYIYIISFIYFYLFRLQIPNNWQYTIKSFIDVHVFCIRDEKNILYNLTLHTTTRNK